MTKKTHEHRPTAKAFLDQYEVMIAGSDNILTRQYLREFYADLENHGFLKEEPIEKTFTREDAESIKDELNQALLEEFGESGFKFSVSLFVPGREFSLVLERQPTLLVRGDGGTFVLTLEGYHWVYRKLHTLVDGKVTAKYNKFYVRLEEE